MGRLPRVVAALQPWANFRSAFSAFEFELRASASLRFNSGRIILHPHAGADRVAVAEDVVHAADVRPEFVVMQIFRRERRRFARVGTIPIVAGNLVGGVRGVLEQIVLRVGCAGFHGGHFGVDGNHRVAETVELVFRFALGRFDHECAGDGPRERRRVKAVIHQPLRHVLGGRALERAQIQNALVRDEAVAAVEGREMFLEPLGNVIRVEDGELRERVHGLNFKMLSAQPISMRATARKEINLRARLTEKSLTTD